MINEIKSSYTLKELFNYINDKGKFNLIVYNKKIQNILGLNILDFRRFSGRYMIGERNGKGKEYNDKDQLIFEGEYKNGKRNGKGKEYDEEGNLIYEGDYLNGKKSGKGKEYSNIGRTLYEGEYLNGKRNGKGYEYYDCYEKDKFKFIGEYLNGKEWNGNGYDMKNNITYEIKNGNGNVKEYDSSGRLRFEGLYMNGLKNGKGKDYYDNGEIEFKGEYLNGKNCDGKQYDFDNKNKIFEIKEGKGYLKEYLNSDLIFEGEYVDGIRNGKCIEYEYKSFDLYIKSEGEYLRGQKYGKWMEYYCEIIEGDEEDEDYTESVTNFILKYEGEYLNGQRNGKGKEYNGERKLIFEG